MISNDKEQIDVDWGGWCIRLCHFLIFLFYFLFFFLINIFMFVNGKLYLIFGEEETLICRDEEILEYLAGFLNHSVCL